MAEEGDFVSTWKSFLLRVATPPVAPVVMGIAAIGGVFLWFSSQDDIPLPPTQAVTIGHTVSAVADSYCRDLSSQAAKLGAVQSGVALALGIVAVFAALLQASPDAADTWTARLRRPFLFLSAPSAILSVILFVRSSASNQLANAANLARAGDLDAALQTCTTAWSAWVLARNDANSVARTAIDEATQVKANALENKVTSVGSQTADSLQQSTQATADNAKAIQQIADAVLSKDAGGVVYAKALASHAEEAAKSASAGAARVKSEAVRSVSAPRATPTATDGGAP
jgi:hypothetical protein